MLDVLLNSVCGSYEPRFFKLEIDHEFKEGITWNELPIDAQSTFIHEYVHYLQGLTTFVSYKEFYVIMKFIQAYLHFIGTSHANEISFPISFDVNGINYSKLIKEMKLLSQYRGDSKIKK